MDDEYSRPGAVLSSPWVRGKLVIKPNIKERLNLAVKQAEERLKAVKEAREIFEKNPDLEKLLNIMQRGLF